MAQGAKRPRPAPRRALRPARDRAALAAGLGGREHLGRAEPGAPEFDASKPKTYVLEMLPYPSGEPHVGHLKCYSVGDAIAHYRRRRGFSVIHPMGYDAFGLPAENNAIATTGEHPRAATESSIASFREQFRQWGISLDWTREVGTTSPPTTAGPSGSSSKLFEQGLAYREEAPVQWCPVDATVLANEQVIDGHCERCGSLVEQRRLEQWFFKITDYARPAARRTSTCSSPGPSTWSRCSATGSAAPRAPRSIFRQEDLGLDFPVFTTRPDTLFGATFFVLAPEHPESSASPPAPRTRARPRLRQRGGAPPPRTAPPRSARRPGSPSAAPSPTPSTASRSRSSSPTTC